MKAPIIPVVDLSELPEEQCDKVLLSLYDHEFYCWYKDQERDPAGLLSLFFQEYDSKRKSFDSFNDWKIYEQERHDMVKEDKGRVARCDTILKKLQTYKNSRFPEKCELAYDLADVVFDYREKLTDVPEENIKIIDALLVCLKEESSAMALERIGMTDQIRILADAQKRVEYQHDASG